MVTLWGKPAENARIGNSYDFRLAVKFEAGEYSLYTPKTGSYMGKIDSRENVVSHEFSLSGQKLTINRAYVIGVFNFSFFYLCLGCKVGKASPLDPNGAFARCASCGAILRIQSCQHQVSASLTVESPTLKNIKLIANSSALMKICQTRSKRSASLPCSNRRSMPTTPKANTSPTSIVQVHLQIGPNVPKLGKVIPPLNVISLFKTETTTTIDRFHLPCAPN